MYVYLDDQKVSICSNADPKENRSCYSQPALVPISLIASSVSPNESEVHSFSQPTQVEDLLLSSQLVTSQTAPTTPNVIIRFILIKKFVY